MDQISEAKFKALIDLQWESVHSHATNQLQNLLADDTHVRDTSKKKILNKSELIAEAEKFSKMLISVIRSQKRCEFIQTERGLQANVTFTHTLLIKPRNKIVLYQSQGHQKWLIKFEGGKHVIEALEISNNFL